MMSTYSKERFHRLLEIINNKNKNYIIRLKKCNINFQIRSNLISNNLVLFQNCIYSGIPLLNK